MKGSFKRVWVLEVLHTHPLKIKPLQGALGRAPENWDHSEVISDCWGGTHIPSTLETPRQVGGSVRCVRTQDLVI